MSHAILRVCVALALFANVLGCGDSSSGETSAASGGGPGTGGAAGSAAGAGGGRTSDSGSDQGAPTTDAPVSIFDRGGEATGPVFDLPADRRAEWAGNVGVEGGIPSRTTTRDCVALYGAHADGTDTSGPINACLKGIASGEVAYLPAGTYVIGSKIDVPSEKSLRGAGSDQTVVRANVGMQSAVHIGGGYTDITSGGSKAIVSGAAKGSTELTLSDTSGLSVGGLIYVSELNDPSIPVSEVGSGGACNWCGVYGSNGKRARLQLAKIAAVSGTTVTIAPPMYFTFSSSLSPQVDPAKFTYVEHAGVENLTVGYAAGVTNAGAVIVFQGAANSWVKNVKVDTCGNRCIDLWYDAYRNEVRDNYITQCLDHVNSDQCYGLQIEAGSANLIENNVFDQTSDGVILVSASGNVIGYNYMHGVHRTASMTQWFWPDNWTHGAHSAYNLFEGNELTAIEWDIYWGTNSHNAAFRNRAHGHDETITYDSYLQATGAILTYYDNRSMTEVGNVLGTAGFHDGYEHRNASGWTDKPIYATGAGGTDDLAFSSTLRHMNFDYFTNGAKSCADTGEPGCQGASPVAALPESLYLGARPPFFTACEPWPPIGPDVAGYVSAEGLPAARRFKGTADPTCP